MIINGTNSRIYEVVFQQKALTEYMIGMSRHSFPFAKANYNAVCIDAVDFTLFDKVICGVLQIDEVLSFEEIANILGLNVEHRPGEGKYIDFGEKEILAHAIDSLIDFNMIETGDIYHSRCRLTDMGKEYTAEGKKFLPATEKTFEIFYDLTDEKHDRARQRFGKLEEASPREHGIALNLGDEFFVKEVSKAQVPEIYNPEKLRNFTDLELIDSDTYAADFTIVGLASFVEKSIRYLAFDSKQNLHQPITEMINSDKNLGNEILKKLAGQAVQMSQDGSRLIQERYEQKAVRMQEDIQKQLSAQKVKEASKKIKDFYLKSELVEAFFLELNFEDFFEEESREFWLILEEMTEGFFQKIKKIIGDKLGIHNKLIIIAQQHIHQEYSTYLSEVSKENPSVFFGVAEEIEQTIILSKNNKSKWAIFRQAVTIEVEYGSIKQSLSKKAFARVWDWEEPMIKIYKTYRKALAHEYYTIIKSTIEKTYDEFMENPMDLSKTGIEMLFEQSKRLSIFRNVKGLSNDIKIRYKDAQEKVETLKGVLVFKLEEELKCIEQKYRVEDANYTISELSKFEDRLLKIKTELFDEKSSLGIKSNQLVISIQEKIKVLSKPRKNMKFKKKKPHRSTTKKR